MYHAGLFGIHSASVVILRRRFQWKNLLQIVLSIIFGWFVSLSGALTALLPQHPSYPIQFIYMLCSIVFLGSGIFLYVTADIMSMPADGVALALAEVSGKPMSSCKIVFDCTVVVLTVILSVTQLHNISGVREGTLIAAFGVGHVHSILGKTHDAAAQSLFIWKIAQKCSSPCFTMGGASFFTCLFRKRRKISSLSQLQHALRPSADSISTYRCPWSR